MLRPNLPGASRGRIEMGNQATLRNPHRTWQLPRSRAGRTRRVVRLACWGIVIATAGSACAGEPASSSAAKPQVIRNLTYVQRGATVLKADVYLPTGPGPFAGVLMVHGGAWAAGNKAHMARHAHVLTSHDYVVVSIAYRLAPQDRFPAPLDDCRAAIRWMRRNADQYKIDPTRIGAYGYSAGGHLVSLLAVTGDAEGQMNDAPADEKGISTRIQCAVAGGAPCDFEWLPVESQALAYFLGGSRRDKPEVYRNASATTFATPDDAPTFFFHGEQDAIVPRRAATALMERLADAGVRTEMYVVPDAGHMGAFLHAEPPQRAVAFLDSVLKLHDAGKPEPGAR